MNNDTNDLEETIYELIKKNQKIEDIIRETIKETDIVTIKKKLNYILFLISN